jgi:hypothetical protein
VFALVQNITVVLVQHFDTVLSVRNEGIFSLRQRVYSGSEILSASYVMGTGGFFRGIKRPAPKADHSPPGSRLRMRGPITSAPHWFFMAWCLRRYIFVASYLVKHRGNFAVLGWSEWTSPPIPPPPPAASTAPTFRLGSEAPPSWIRLAFVLPHKVLDGLKQILKLSTFQTKTSHERVTNRCL